MRVGRTSNGSRTSLALAGPDPDRNSGECEGGLLTRTVLADLRGSGPRFGAFLSGRFPQLGESDRPCMHFRLQYSTGPVLRFTGRQTAS